jgi:hypothetical protein
MRTVAATPTCDEQIERLHQLSGLLEQALRDTNELHHRIREIQLRVAELSASIEAGRSVSVVRAMP